MSAAGTAVKSCRVAMLGAASEISPTGTSAAQGAVATGATGSKRRRRALNPRKITQAAA